MIPFTLLVGLAIGWAAAMPGPEEGNAAPHKDLKSGLVYVFFDDGGFQRPGSHGKETGIRSHGAVTEITSHGVDPQIDLDIQGIQGFSQLWIGWISFPVAGEITFAAEADDGLRVRIGDQWVINGWAPGGQREGTIRAVAGETLPIRVEYYQAGGDSYLRLHWQWEGQPRQLVPPSAFWHSPRTGKPPRRSWPAKRG